MHRARVKLRESARRFVGQPLAIAARFAHGDHVHGEKFNQGARPPT
jgi:hypothetical protein